MVIYGPNGSGKSSVVDAIDFLLTGNISRLTGVGTRGITLSDHGRHVDCEPEEARVRAIVRLSSLQASLDVEIERCIAEPDNLKCDSSAIAYLEPIITLAKRGQHVLTRREILKYITAKSGDRAQQIQELLNLTEIEDIRKALVGARTLLENELKTARTVLDKEQGQVNLTVRTTAFSTDDVLRFANNCRAILGGRPITILHSGDLKFGIKPLSVTPSDRPVNVSLFDKDLEYLLSLTSQQQSVSIEQADKRLRDLTEPIRSNPELLLAFRRRELIEQGISLIDDSGKCPLCETAWPPGELRTFLEQRLLQAKAVVDVADEINELSKKLLEQIHTTIAGVRNVARAAELVDANNSVVLLQAWVDNLSQLVEKLTDAVELYPDPSFGSDQVCRMLAPYEIEQHLEHIRAEVKTKYPETTPEQDAWDALTRLEENLKGLESAKSDVESAELAFRRANILHDSFLKARDEVYETLYNKIGGRFEQLYKYLHGDDEHDFAATLKPEKAGLKFEVSFYGRGKHPPHALHSEGHQDSMGLCLFLALSEELTQGLIDLVVLDDVVMSVDAGHRRQVCRMLANLFPNRQFIITTHDKTWSRQLNTEGVVTSRQVIEFYNWDIQTGPQVNQEADMWARIKADLERNDVSSAAGRLRRGLEEYFGQVCDALHAPVPYKLSGRYELGDLMPSAYRQFCSWLDRAKRAARSWDDRKALEILEQVHSIARQVYNRTQAESWTVNASIHYNSWHDFSISDFEPVVEAFQDLCALFVCSECGSAVHLVQREYDPQNIRCNCGNINWNLVEKQKNH